jgi:hypothetical protein
MLEVFYVSNKIYFHEFSFSEPQEVAPCVFGVSADEGALAGEAG